MASLIVAVGIGCGGAPPPAATPAEPVTEDFGPGLVAHESSIDALSNDAARVLRASYTVAAVETPGVLTTEWAEHDAARWPGVQTRLLVEITDSKVIVRVQCRSATDSCARTMPEDIRLVELAQRVADEIAWGGGVGEILAKMAAFGDRICACRDMDCVQEVEKGMMEWAMKNMDRMKKMKPTRAQDEQADRIEERMDACKAKLEPPSPPAITRPPPPPGSTGSYECDEYLKTFDHVVQKCAHKLGPALDAMKQSREAQAEAFEQWATLDDASFEATIEAAASGCKAATDAIRQSAVAMGCKL